MDQRAENSTCFNCLAENVQNMEDHLKICPLELVECGWCGLRQSRKVFKEHIVLAKNPEKELNHEQQCMQRQCRNLYKQQNKQSDAIQKLSNDMKHLNQQDGEFSEKFQVQDCAIQRLSDDIKTLNQQHNKFNDKFQQYVTWKSLIVYTVLMLIINSICSHYWLQSQQIINNYETIKSQVNALNQKFLVDNHTNETLTGKKVKYEASENYDPFANDIDWIKDMIIKLNKSKCNETNPWQRWMTKAEENFTRIISETNNQLNKSYAQFTLALADTERDFANTTDLIDLRSQVENQLNLITKLNQSLLTDAKHWMEIKGNFMGEVDLINDQITNLSQSIPNEMKQLLTEIKENFNTLVARNISVVNDQLKVLNQSMLNETKQWLNQLTELKETFTKRIANLSFEMHTLKFIESNHSNIAIDEGMYCSQPADHGSIYEHQDFTELKLLEQSNRLHLEDSELVQTLPAIFKMINFNEKVKNTEQCYGGSFFAFNGGYFMILKVCISAGHNDCKGIGVSVFLRPMKGPYDDELQRLGHWPLKGTFRVELFSSLSNSTQEIIFSTYTCSECTKRVIDANIKPKRWGYTQFI